MSIITQAISKFAVNLVSDLVHEATPNASHKVAQTTAQAIAHAQPGIQLFAQSIGMGARAVNQLKQNQGVNFFRVYDFFRHYVQQAIQHGTRIPNKLGYKSTATRFKERLTSSYPLSKDIDYNRMANSLRANGGKHSPRLPELTPPAAQSTKPTPEIAKTAENKPDARKPSVIEGIAKGFIIGILTLVLSPLGQFQTRFAIEGQTCKQALSSVLKNPGAGAGIGMVSNIVENTVLFGVSGATGSATLGSVAATQLTKGLALAKQRAQTQGPNAPKISMVEILRSTPSAALKGLEILANARNASYLGAFNFFYDQMKSQGYSPAIAGSVSSVIAGFSNTPVSNAMSTQRKYVIAGDHEAAKLRNLIPSMLKKGVGSLFRGAMFGVGIMAVKGLILGNADKAVSSFFDSKKVTSSTQPAPKEVSMSSSQEHATV